MGGAFGGKAHAPCLQPLRASYRRCAHGTMTRGMISAIAAACAATSAKSTNTAMSPSTFRRRASSLTNPRAAAASMKIVSTSASVAAALPRASRFSATTCRRAVLTCARFADRRARLRRRFRSRLINRETLCVECARRVLFGFRRKRTLCLLRAMSFSSLPVLKRPLQAPRCALIQ